MKKIKHLIFDFDGTLVNSKTLFLTLFNELAQKKGYRLMDELALLELKNLSFFERAKYLKVPLIHLPFIIPIIYKRYKAHLPQLKLIDGIETVLATLYKAGFSMDIVSSNSEENIRLFLEAKGINYFSTISCSKNVMGKDILLRKLIKEQGYRHEEIIYLGDEARDLEASNKVGIQTIWVAWGYDTQTLIETLRPTYLAHQPSDLLAILL